MKLNEILKKYSVTLKEKEVIPELTKDEKNKIDKLIDRDVISISDLNKDFFNFVYSRYLESRKEDITPNKWLNEIIYNGKSYIGSLTHIYNCGEAIINKYYVYPFSNNYTEFIKPFGSLSLCVMIELLEERFGKNILEFTREDRDMVRNDFKPNPTHIPTIIYKKYEELYLNHVFYVYYPWISLKNPWKIRKAKIKSINENFSLIDTETRESIYLGEYSFSRNNWLVALDKDMLIKQLYSLKDAKLKGMSDNILKLEKSIPKLEKKLEDTRLKIEENIYNYAFEEEKLNKIIEDGKTA